MSTAIKRSTKCDKSPSPTVSSAVRRKIKRSKRALFRISSGSKRRQNRPLQVQKSIVGSFWASQVQPQMAIVLVAVILAPSPPNHVVTKSPRNLSQSKPLPTSRIRTCTICRLGRWTPHHRKTLTLRRRQERRLASRLSRLLSR